MLRWLACHLLGHRVTYRAVPPACGRCGRSIRDEATVLWFWLAFLAVAALVTVACVSMLRRSRRG